VWPAAGRGVPFDVVLPAAAEVEVLARVDTPERAVGRLAHHLRDISMLQIDPDVDYLRRAVAAFRAELRRERDRTAGSGQPPAVESAYAPMTAWTWGRWAEPR
jgi:hypothetical protein